MAASTTKNTILRMGIDRTEKTGYLLIGNPDWHSVEVGKKYTLTFRFDRESPWSGNFTGTRMGSSVTLGIHVDDQFMKDFASKKTLIIFYQDRAVVSNLPLTDSLAAMQSVIQCQTKVDSVVAGQTDPFSKRDAAQAPLDLTKPRDPFSSGSRVRPASDPFDGI